MTECVNGNNLDATVSTVEAVTHRQIWVKYVQSVMTVFQSVYTKSCFKHVKASSSFISCVQNSSTASCSLGRSLTVSVFMNLRINRMYIPSGNRGKRVHWYCDQQLDNATSIQHNFFRRFVRNCFKVINIFCRLGLKCTSYAWIADYSALFEANG